MLLQLAVEPMSKGFLFQMLCIVSLLVRISHYDSFQVSSGQLCKVTSIHFSTIYLIIVGQIEIRFRMFLRT